MTQLAHKIRLDPNNEQVTYFKRACGVRRFAYNWACKKSRETRKSGYDLVKLFNSIKAEEFPWVSEVSKWAPQKAIQDHRVALELRKALIRLAHAKPELR